MTGDHKVNIAKELKVASGQRTLGLSKNVKRRQAKADSFVKRAIRKICKEGTRVSTRKVSQLLPQKTSPSTVRRR